MNDATIRQLLADVLWDCAVNRADEIADALLAFPLADIIDLAAFLELDWDDGPDAAIDPEVRVLLKSWREERSTTDG